MSPLYQYCLDLFIPSCSQKKKKKEQQPKTEDLHLLISYSNKKPNMSLLPITLFSLH